MMRSIAATLSLLALEACVHEQVFEPAAGASLAPGRENVAEAIAAGVTVKAARDSWKGDPKDLGSLFTPARGMVSASIEPSSVWLRLAEWEQDRFANWPQRRPTQDMHSEALPEGVVEDGGSVAGVVYFESVIGRESAVELEMTLVDSSDGQTFGGIAIPFQTLESQRYPAAEQGAAQHAATLEALDILRNAEWMLATGTRMA